MYMCMALFTGITYSIYFSWNLSSEYIIRTTQKQSSWISSRICMMLWPWFTSYRLAWMSMSDLQGRSELRQLNETQAVCCIVVLYVTADQSFVVLDYLYPVLYLLLWPLGWSSPDEFQNISCTKSTYLLYLYIMFMIHFTGSRISSTHQSVSSLTCLGFPCTMAGLWIPRTLRR